MTTSSSILSFGTAKSRLFFKPEEIVRLEASSNYTKIFFANKTKLISTKVLKEYVLMLEPFGFIRTHRTHLVNRRHILSVMSNGSILMNDDSCAEISRRLKREVLLMLNL